MHLLSWEANASPGVAVQLIAPESASQAQSIAPPHNSLPILIGKIHHCAATCQI
jgi:hypothetical protein